MSSLIFQYLTDTIYSYYNLIDYWCVACGANWILLWWCLKLANGYAGSGAFRRGICYRSMSDAACDCPWGTSLEVQSDPQFLAPSALLGCAWKDQVCTKAGFQQPQARGQVSKIPKSPEIYFHLPSSASCLLDSVTERTSIGGQVVWSRFSGNHQKRASVHKINTDSS